MNRSGPDPAAGASSPSSQDLGRHPLVRALLEWVDGFALILDDERRILAASDNIPADIVQADREGLLGRRPGEALHCAHLLRTGQECGAGTACRFCGAMKAMRQTRADAAPIHTEYKVTKKEEDGEVTFKFDLGVYPLPLEGAVRTGLFFRPAGREEQRRRFSRSSGGAVKIPSDLANYRKIRTLGVGAVGSVFLVADEEGRPFALKTLHEELEASSKSLQRFRREWEIALSLDHPNIVRTLQAGRSEDGTVYLLSEYCPRGSVYRHLQLHGVLPVELSLFWMIGATRGLDYLWRERRIVHRDIKPDNLLVDAAYRVKIGDFGIARAGGGTRSRLTGPEALLGTPHYMSPEQIRGDDDLDGRSDLYGLGVTVYELLTGETPFESSDSVFAMTRHMAEAPVPVRARRQEVPADVAGIVESLLAKRREDRPGDAAALLEALLSAAEALGLDPDVAPLSFLEKDTDLTLHPQDRKTRAPE